MPPRELPPRSRPAPPGLTPDDYDAIREAVMRLEPGDALLIAGKGHETGQIVGSEVIPFSDHRAVAEVLAREAA